MTVQVTAVLLVVDTVTSAQYPVPQSLVTLMVRVTVVGVVGVVVGGAVVVVVGGVVIVVVVGVGVGVGVGVEELTIEQLTTTPLRVAEHVDGSGVT